MSTVLLFSCFFAVLQFTIYYFFSIEIIPSIPFQSYDFELVTLRNYVRVSGLMNGPSEFGIILASLVPFLIFNISALNNNYDKIKLLMFLIVILITLSRSAYLALFVAVISSSIFLINKKVYWKYLLLFTPLALMILLFTPIGETVMWRLFANDGYTTSSSAGHAMYARAAFESFYSNPIFGVGIGNYEVYVQDNVFFQ